ncbi:hypothetical protein [Rhizobium leguminosarum]|uniref:hypothetical protein n=1 Tax=Rhizobium leguminosarum TaxID=384 RepID=UPI001C97494B|nr:hypothetical protein [Rhizobium leguminosarum]MBY5585075.1 hypothetical protein [Rhizobium leguminosarum]
METNEPQPRRRIRAGRSIISFVKEWGGIGTLLIALLYSFPSSVLDQWQKSKGQRQAAEKDALASVRGSLSEMAALRAEKASRLLQSSDAHYQNEISGAYDIRIYNLIYIRKDEFKNQAPKLRSSELYMVGSSLSLIGEINEAQYYYDLAIVAAGKEQKPGTVITIYREKGNSLFQNSPDQDIDKARSAYVSVLSLLSTDKSSYSRYTYVTDLSELIAFEMSNGDWQCGISYRDYVNSLFQQLNQKDNPFLSNYYKMFNEIKVPPRSGGGCPEKIPLHPAFAPPDLPPGELAPTK